MLEKITHTMMMAAPGQPCKATRDNGDDDDGDGDLAQPAKWQKIAF